MDFYPFLCFNYALKWISEQEKQGPKPPKSTLKSGFRVSAKMQKMQKVQTARPCCGRESAENQYDRILRPPLLPHTLGGYIQQKQGFGVEYSTKTRVSGANHSTYDRVKEHLFNFFQG